MQPKIISKYHITVNLTDYSNNYSQKLYEYNGEVYYFIIHDHANRLADGLSFNPLEKLIVLLHPKGLKTFDLTYIKGKWKTSAESAKAIPKEILQLVINEVIKVTDVE